MITSNQSGTIDTATMATAIDMVRVITVVMDVVTITMAITTNTIVTSGVTEVTSATITNQKDIIGTSTVAIIATITE